MNRRGFLGCAPCNLVKRLIRSALAATITATVLGLVPASGGEAMLKLLKVLKDRGSISEVEYRMLLEAAQAESAPGSGNGSGPAPVPAPLPAPVPTPSALAPDPSGAASLPPPGVASARAPGVAIPDRWEEQRGGTVQDSSLADAVSVALKGKWYERLNLRGYAQLRYGYVFEGDGAGLNVPNDASVGGGSTFLLRRGRVVLSGDATDRLFVYAQADFNASLGSGEYAVAMRDYYGDLALDSDKEFRVRVGQSKVPFGWVNMQSSQNRGPQERPDALNGAVEGERDLGVFGYWAPGEIRRRYRDLVRLGLKGSGDFGVAGLGAYSGQGLNRLDLNGDPHVVARLNYPWKLPNGQFVETGIQGYHGRFVSGVSAIDLGSGTFTPGRFADGTTDERLAATFVWYPQPFGLEAEWTVGRGPELDPDTRWIGSRALHGGYVQVAYRVERFHGDWYPFARWHYYDGGRKFASNAPRSRVNEVDIGIEWQPWPEVELTISYTRTVERTNTRTAPYAAAEGADRVGFQVQINY